ncbi:MAG: hypothetical protein KKA07_13305 [Bacteroidetes bacterium]|nr:hypothetical protein [Bacteroidota bacterium]MBU1720037.1 hypothetical protein [Bacteroidota bacterium]
MRYLFIIFSLIILLYGTSGAQPKSNVNATYAESSLQAEIVKLSNISSYLSKCIYSDSRARSEYFWLLSSVDSSFKTLNQIKETFESLSKNNETETDYYVKIAYTDLAFISIYNRRNELLIAANRDKIQQWEMGEFQHMKSAKNNIEKAEKFDVDKEKPDLKILKAIILFYENKGSEAFAEMQKLIIAFEKMNKKVMIGNKINYDEYIAYVHSWMAYISLVGGNTSLAESFLDSTLSSNYPQATLDWAHKAKKVMQAKKTKLFEINLTPFLFPEQESKKYISYLAPIDDLNISTYQFKEAKVALKYEPEVLIANLELTWRRLMNIEEIPWRSAKSCLVSNKPTPGSKNLFSKPDEMYVRINAKNKGSSSTNKNKYIRRFNAIFEIYLRLLNYSDSWSALIEVNPNIPFLRYYRIKTNLGLYYISTNKNDYLDVFKYTSINITALTDMKSAFEKNPINQIREDLGYLSSNYPQNLFTDLAAAEVSVFTEDPNTALSRIDKLLKTADKEYKLASLVGPTGDVNTYKEIQVTEIGALLNKSNQSDIDITGYLHAYKAYLFFKLRKFREVRDEIDLMSSCVYLEGFTKNLEERMKFLEAKSTLESQLTK